MPKLNEKEKMIVRLALQDRLNHMHDIGIPDDHVLVTDTKKILDRMRTTL